MEQSTIPAGALVELASTTDPYTLLRPGAVGWVRRSDADRLDVVWAGGSTLSMLPDEGDRVRTLELAEVPDPELVDLAKRVTWPDNAPLLIECVQRGLYDESLLPVYRVATMRGGGGEISVERYPTLDEAIASVAGLLGDRADRLTVDRRTGRADFVGEGDLVQIRPEEKR